jgi:hypothetical protein
LKTLGLEPNYEKTVSNDGLNTPDFTVMTTEYGKVTFECTVLYEDKKIASIEHHRNHLFEYLDEQSLKHKKMRLRYSIGINIIRESYDDPPKRKIFNFLLSQINSSGAGTYRFESDNWEVEIIVDLKEAPSDKFFVETMSLPGGWLNAHDLRFDKLRKKAAKYNQLDHPLVLVLTCKDSRLQSFDHDDIRELLFGQSGMTFQFSQRGEIIDSFPSRSNDGAYSGECCHPVRFYPATSNFFTFLQSGIQ